MAHLSLLRPQDPDDAPAFGSASRFGPFSRRSTLEDSNQFPESNADDDAFDLDGSRRGADESAGMSAPGFRRLLSLARPDARWLTLGLLSLFARLPFSLAAPHFVSRAIGGAIAGSAARARSAVTAFVVAGVVNAALDFWNVFLFAFVQNRVVRRLRSTLFAKILRQEAGFFDANQAGSLSSRLTSDCVAIASDLSWVFRNVAEAAVRVAGIAGYLLFQNARLGLVACGATPLVALVARLYGEWMSANASASQEALAAANAAALEAIANARTVKAFANEKYESRRYDRALARWYALCTTQAYVTGGYYALVYSFCSQLLVPAALLAYGSELVLAGEMPAERLVAAMLYQQQLQEYVGNLLDAVTSMYKSSGAASAAFALIDRAPRVRASGNAVVADFSGTVKLSGVHFSYPTRPERPVLRGVTLKAMPGSVTALVGASGSGKSTVFRLLLHAYEPELGAVTLDGVDVSMVSARWLHSVIGVVGQEPVLFAGTVLDNITYSRRANEADRAEARAAERGARRREQTRGRRAFFSRRGDGDRGASAEEAFRYGENAVSYGDDAYAAEEEEAFFPGVSSPGVSPSSSVAHLDEDDERRRDRDRLRAKPPDEAVMRAASAANAHGFISAMPRGYHTEVGEGGAQLSGGQKQRVAIARAVLQNPVVLLLDEATSSLDRQAETHVQAALDVVSRGRTTLTIAHRLSAIRAADKIFVLRDGAVAESGTHESLSRAHAAGGAPPGSYRALYRGHEAESGLYESDDDESGEGEY